MAVLRSKGSLSASPVDVAGAPLQRRRARGEACLKLIPKIQHNGSILEVWRRTNSHPRMHISFCLHGILYDSSPLFSSPYFIRLIPLYEGLFGEPLWRDSCEQYGEQSGFMFLKAFIRLAVFLAAPFIQRVGYLKASDACALSQ